MTSRNLLVFDSYEVTGRNVDDKQVKVSAKSLRYIYAILPAMKKASVWGVNSAGKRVRLFRFPLETPSHMLSILSIA